MPANPTVIWRNPEKPLRWEWTFDEEPGVGGTQYSVEVKDGKIEWRYTEDRWGRSDDQSFADFAEFGPMWSTPQEILPELIAHFAVGDRPWQQPGYVDYSPVWWAVDRFKLEALSLITAEDAHRRYHSQRTLLMLAAEKPAVEKPDSVVARLLSLGADPNAPNVGLNPNANALHNAVCSGSLAAVQQLVEAGASVDSKDGPYQATPLAWAEYFVRESGADKVEYFQREGPRPKQYAEIASYLRGKEGASLR